VEEPQEGPQDLRHCLKLPVSLWCLQIYALDTATPPPSGGSTLVSDYTPASAAWLESARKVDDLRSRLQSLEEALQNMEAKAVQQLDKHLQVGSGLSSEDVLGHGRWHDVHRAGEKTSGLTRCPCLGVQEKVLATALKLVERRFNDCELDRTIQERVLTTAMKLVAKVSGLRD
jgi:hypothetical protein